MDKNELLRELPSVDELLGRLNSYASHYPHEILTAEIRRVLEAARESITVDRQPFDDARLQEELVKALDRLGAPSLRRVINATGVILHTNLGRAPLPHFQPMSGYSNLEFDLENGKRGKRDVHISPLLEKMLGCPAIVVNNNAAAVYLTLNELAAGSEAIVSRGELIEIGDGFRIPDIMARSGAILREVGTTNRTTIDDYRQAINDRTRVILRVHPSNFRMEGFTSKPDLAELAALARERDVLLYEDLGSGCLMDLHAYGIHEPTVDASLRAGANVVSFSTDKLLGGPQSGIIAGDAALVGRIRRNPMFRAFRVDKLILQALENTLRHILFHRFGEIPAMRMLMLSADEIRKRAEKFAPRLGGFQTEIIRGESVIGGGSTPAQSIPTWLIAIHADDAAGFERALRHADPPVVARIENDRVVLDLRTVHPDEELLLGASIMSCGAH